MRNALMLSAASLSLLSACTEKPTAADPYTVMAAIARTEEAQSAALARNDLEAAVSVFAQDTTMYYPGMPPLAGRDAIRAYHVRALKDPALKVVIDEPSRKVWVAASGELATTTYKYAWTRTDAQRGKVLTEQVVAQTTWQKQADGSWKNVSDINAVYPAAETAGK